MSSKKEMTDYMYLQPGDKVQVWDQWLDQFGQWQFYTCTGNTEGVVGYGVKARRPIGKTNQTVFEEVPGSRTTQDAVSQPQRERIAYEELRPGDRIQPGDEWKNGDGRWQPYVCLTGLLQFVQDGHAARRPYRVNTIMIDALADAHAATAQLRDERDEARAAIAQVKAEFNSQADVLAEVRADEKRLVDNLELLRSEYLKLQNERDELKTALRESHAAHEFTMKQGLEACKERGEACKERDLARSEVARLSTELWARKPLEDRVASLTEELANAREDIQKLVKTNADNADQFAEHTKFLVHERDEARAKSDRLQGLIDDLLDEPTAKQVQDMLRTWATELDWSAGCFDSVGREQIDTIQKTLVAVIERIETVVNPEGGRDGE